VIDRDTYTRLQQVLLREGRSLLQYARDSFPWTNHKDGEKVGALRQISDEETEAIARLGRFLLKNHLSPPLLGAFPMAFTSYNYLSLPRLIALLIEHQRQGIADLQADIPHINDREARSVIQYLLELKKQHLERLQALEAPAQEPVTA
jgi:hypothetical protein